MTGESAHETGTEETEGGVGSARPAALNVLVTAVAEAVATVTAVVAVMVVALAMVAVLAMAPAMVVALVMDVAPAMVAALAMVAVPVMGVGLVTGVDLVMGVALAMDVEIETGAMAVAGIALEVLMAAGEMVTVIIIASMAIGPAVRDMDMGVTGGIAMTMDTGVGMADTVVGMNAIGMKAGATIGSSMSITAAGTAI